MKRILSIFLAFLMCVTLYGCAERMDGLEDEFRDMKTFSSQNKAYVSGFMNFLSKSDTQKKPLINKGRYCSVKDIEFDLDFVPDDRFISCEDMYGAADGYIRNPSANYLTSPDGTRMKLCPNLICRESNSEKCKHVNLMGGIVDGRYVYYIGKYNNGRSKKVNRTTKTSLDYSNYLMRYDIAENENQCVAELPWYASIACAAYGCLYIFQDEPAGESLNSRNRCTLIYDMKNVRIAEADFDCINFFGSAANGLWIYYAIGNSIYRTSYNLKETEKLDSGDYSYTSQKSDGYVGEAKGKVFFKRYSYDDGLWDIVSVDRSGRVRVILKDIAGYFASDGSPRIPAVAAGDFLYVASGRFVYRYALEYRGRIMGEAEVVFSEEKHCKPLEVISSVDKYGDTVKVSTLSGDEGRIFILTEDGPVLDGEGGV